MDSPKYDVDSVDWEKMLPRLYAFAAYLLKSKTWFRPYGSDSYVAGKEVGDYVKEAIEQYLAHPEKYNPQKGELVDYLKYNIIRTLVGNDCRSAENRTTVPTSTQPSDEDDHSSYIRALETQVAPLFDSQIDYDTIMQCVEQHTKGNRILEELFTGIYCDGLKRRDLMKEFGMSAGDYAKGMRQLGAIFSKVAKQFHIKKEDLV